MGFSLEDEIYSEQNINVVEAHLKFHFPDAYDSEFTPYNPSMVNRQRSILRGEFKPTRQDINWMRHELIENALMVDGEDYNVAHKLANEVLGLSGDWDLWPTEVYDKYHWYLGNPLWDEEINKR